MRNVFMLFLLTYLFLIMPAENNILNAQTSGIIEQQSLKCFGDSTGQLSMNAGFGSPPYTYLWSNGQTTQSIGGLKAGLYSVTVTDSQPASIIFSHNLISPPPITSSYNIIPNSGWPINNGSIDITAGGGSGWYNYVVKDSLSREVWNQTTTLFDSLASGAFYITISDANNCKRNDTVHVPELSGLYVGVGVDNTACYNSCAWAGFAPDLAGVYPMAVRFDKYYTVVIIDTVTGLKPYVLSTLIDTVQSASHCANPGFHIVSVTSSNGKGFRYSWTVDSVVAPVSISWTETNVSCYGNHTGSITALAQGSYNGYSYHISGPGFSGSSNIANGLYAGIFSVVATDYTGCSLTQAVTISQPDEPNRIIFNDPIPPSCINAKNGSVSIDRVDGSSPPLLYHWSNGSLSRGIDSLFAGKYKVTITDGHGCIAKDSVEIEANTGEHHIFFDIPVNATCVSANNGALSVHGIENFTEPITFTWSNGGTAREISSLYPGIYSVTATDANNCISYDSIEVRTDAGSFRIIFDIPKNSTCAYTSDGEIKILRVEGVTEPVSFSWSTGGTNPEVSSLPPGIYTVTVTDANNCTSQNSISVLPNKESCIFNVVTPNGDGYNDYLDLSGLCNGLKMEAEIFNESGKKIIVLNESHPYWDGKDPSKPPTGASSSYIVFIQLYKDGQPYVKFSETVSVIYSK